MQRASGVQTTRVGLDATSAQLPRVDQEHKHAAVLVLKNAFRMDMRREIGPCLPHDLTTRYHVWHGLMQSYQSCRTSRLSHDTMIYGIADNLRDSLTDDPLT